MTTPRPPYNTRVPRRGDSATGRRLDQTGRGREILPGLLDTTIREGAGANTWDRYTSHERVPWYHQPYQIGNANTLVDWTRCGPVRPSLHQLQQTLRTLVGTTATRNLDPHPRPRLGTQDQGHGMHTNPEPGRKRTAARYAHTAQMQPARVGRLSASRQNGQSYSQTTRVQGG